jgi:hypothetical protein
MSLWFAGYPKSQAAASRRTASSGHRSVSLFAASGRVAEGDKAREQRNGRDQRHLPARMAIRILAT